MPETIDLTPGGSNPYRQMSASLRIYAALVEGLGVRVKSAEQQRTIVALMLEQATKIERQVA